MVVVLLLLLLLLLLCSVGDAIVAAGGNAVETYQQLQAELLDTSATVLIIIDKA